MKKIFTSNSTGRWIIFWTMVCSALINSPAQANNIRINTPVKVSAGTGDTLVLEFPLQWDNSWRDEFNWDAAWVFLKYKVGSGDWKHVPLSFGGHSFNGSSGQPVHFDYMPGQTGSNTLGLFVYRSKLEAGNTPEIICKLKCLKSALGGLTAEKFDTHEAFIRAQGIEMVYVPYGAYYLGDDTSNKSFEKIIPPLYGQIPESSDIVNNTSGYIITASHEYFPATNAADHQNAPVYPTGSWYTHVSAACWWKIDFNIAKTIRYFGVSGATNYPTSFIPIGIWNLEGSNDNATWTILSAVDPSVWRATATSYPVQQSIKIDNPRAYRYYRLNFPQNAPIIVQNIAMTEDDLYSFDNSIGELIDSEDSWTVITSGNSYTLPATYPKGYKGFYTMKYELSQEQYVAFLNTLTYAQQQERVLGLASMKEGDYIFGDRTQPSNRNGICVAVASFSGLPVLFANNLTNDKKYAQDNDGKTVACNYLSPNDMLSYCSWSGLRPMSELEYEKTCRPVYPELALLKGYAWNSTSVAGRLSSVNNGGQRNELSGSNNTNVNAGNTFGPVRCGLFATSASNQQAAGATFWGAMEMSGNLKELCYNVNAASTFNGTVLGDGTYAVNKWNNAVGNFGVRGGGFTSNDDLLRVSDRTEVTGYFAGLEQHDSTVTFRGVYPIAGAVDAGTIEVVKACPDNIEIKSSKDASSKFDLTYLWYVLKPGSSVWEMIPGESGAAISNYVITEDFGTDVSRTYKFKRKAVALVGEATTAEVSLTIPNMNLTLSSSATAIDACDRATKVTATGYGSPVYEWKYDNRTLSTTNVYIPSFNQFNGFGDYKVNCIMTQGQCIISRELKVHLPDIKEVASNAATNAACGDIIIIDKRDNLKYCTIKVDNTCWMGINLKYKTGNNWTYDINKYGVYYDWATAMNGAFSQNTNPSTVRGICPEGWHLPSQSEWENAGNNAGLVASLLIQLGGLYNGNHWEAVEGYGLWWSTTSCYRGQVYGGYTSVGVRPCGNGYDDTDGMGIRCVKD